MAHGVGRRIHAVRHDGTITEHMVGLPIISGIGAGLITTCAGIANGNVAKESHGRDRVVGVIHPDAIVNASGRICQSGRLAEDIGSTYTEVVVFIPIGVGA